MEYEVKVIDNMNDFILSIGKFIPTGVYMSIGSKINDFNDAYYVINQSIPKFSLFFKGKLLIIMIDHFNDYTDDLLLYKNYIKRHE